MTNRPIIIAIIVEAEYDVTNYAGVIFRPYLLVDFPQTFAFSVSRHRFGMKTDVFPCSRYSLKNRMMIFCDTSVRVLIRNSATFVLRTAVNAIKFLFGSLARLRRSAELKRILPGNEAAGAIYAIRPWRIVLA